MHRKWEGNAKGSPPARRQPTAPETKSVALRFLGPYVPFDTELPNMTPQLTLNPERFTLWGRSSPERKGRGLWDLIFSAIYVPSQHANTSGDQICGGNKTREGSQLFWTLRPALRFRGMWT